MDLKIENRRFVCIDYPAVVKDSDKMLATLGGEETVAKVLANENKRLELKLRPCDAFCKPAYGDRCDTTRLLLRVRRRKKKSTKLKVEENATGSQNGSNRCETCCGKSESDEPCPECAYEYNAKMLGYVDTSYKFQSLVDFQYLPVTRNEEGYQSLTDQLVLKGVKPRSWMNSPDSPLHITPPIFSRIDQPIEYCYRDGPKHRPGYNDPMKDQPAHLIGVARQRRPHFTIFVNFADPEIPSIPMEEAVEKVNSRRIDKTQVERIKQLFDERPIWSKNAIRCQKDVNIGADQLKHILPSVGYYWLNGPWRALWTRFGYDPRKNPDAKRYQLVDYRVRQRSAAEKLKIQSKRSSYQYTLPTQVVRSQASAATIQQDTFTQDWSKDTSRDKKQLQDPMYKFWPGVRPPCRQMFYQLCDVDEPNIQAMVASNDGKEKECTERDGWCITEYQEKCRAILIKHVQKIIADGDSMAKRLQELSEVNSRRKKKRDTKKTSNVKFYPEGAESQDSSGTEDEGEMLDGMEELEVNDMETEILDLMEEEEPAGQQQEDEPDASQEEEPDT